MVDDQKIKVILEWEKPKTTKGLRSFLGLASYYRKLVRDFAKIAKPLSDLLKKSVSEIWDEHCYRAFGAPMGCYNYPIHSKPSSKASSHERSAASESTLGRGQPFVRPSPPP